LLIVDPKQRWTVTHALQCDWFQSYNLTSSKTTMRRSPDDVRGFRARFRKNESIQGLIDIFESRRFETTTNDNAIKTTHSIYDGWKSKKSILQNTGNIILENFSNHTSSERMRPKSKSEGVKDKIVVDTSLHRKNRASFYASKLNNWISNEATINDNNVKKTYSLYDGRNSKNDKLEDTSNNTFETSNDKSSSETNVFTYDSKSKSGEAQDTGAINTSLHLNNTASFYASKLNNWISTKASNF